MSTNHLASSSAHDVNSPSSSSPSRHARSSVSTHEMLHSTDATLAQELATLHRLQCFYEQHTFDTQGPYADLFAVLLSSCKHLIDTSTALVRHLRAHDAALHRQRAMCDALCSEVAQHRSLLASLHPRIVHTAARTAAVARVDEDVKLMRTKEPSKTREVHIAEEHHVCEDGVCATTSPSSASTSASMPFSQHQPRKPEERRSGSEPVAVRGDDLRASASPSHGGNAREDTAWIQVLLQRLDSMEEKLADFTVNRHSTKSLIPSQQQPLSFSESDVTPLPAEPSTHAHHALVESLNEWKRVFEDALGGRVENLAQHVASLERVTRQHERQLRWMGSSTEDSASQDDPHARPTALQGSESALPEAPPSAVTQWLHAELQQREEEWRRVLDDVRDALETHRISEIFKRHQGTRARDENDTPAKASTALEASEAPPHRASFADALTQLFCVAKADLTDTQKELDSVVRQAALADEQLRGVVGRLEVLEVYAPHRYAVAAAPPVLGVELQDVHEPRIAVRVRAVYRGYVADRAGLSVGDVIAGVGHHSVQTRAQLYVVLAELTRDYNAQCRMQIEAGYMRHYTAAASGLVDRSILTNLETSYNDDGAAAVELDQMLQRARAEAAGASHKTGGAAELRYRANSSSAAGSKPAFAYPVYSQHKELLAQCLPYFELTLHVLRDGRLRDVTVLVPPSDALRSVTQY
ncbi:hypothetical protein N2W54_000787 [Lotmaria passim]